jgi:surface antigen
MLRRAKTLALLGAAVISAGLRATAVDAQNLWFTRDMPISRMNSEDINILQAAVFDTLDNVANGQSRHWENPKTRAHGDLTPRSSFTDAGLRCRELEIANSAGGLDNRSVITLCKLPEGWKIRPN